MTLPMKKAAPRPSVAITAAELKMLAENAYRWATTSTTAEDAIARSWWMRLIGEVWRMRGKLRYKLQRIRDLEGREPTVSGHDWAAHAQASDAILAHALSAGGWREPHEHLPRLIRALREAADIPNGVDAVKALAEMRARHWSPPSDDDKARAVVLAAMLADRGDHGDASLVCRLAGVPDVTAKSVPAADPAERAWDVADARRAVIEHLEREERFNAAQDFERATEDEPTLDRIALIAERNEDPSALPFELWERLRPGLGAQRRVEQAVVDALPTMETREGGPGGLASVGVVVSGVDVVEVSANGYAIGREWWEKVQAAIGRDHCPDWSEVVSRRIGAFLALDQRDPHVRHNMERLTGQFAANSRSLAFWRGPLPDDEEDLEDKAAPELPRAHVDLVAWVRDRVTEYTETAPPGGDSLGVFLTEAFRDLIIRWCEHYQGKATREEQLSPDRDRVMHSGGQASAFKALAGILARSR